jgi:probable HAF family extracellular repeat protein
MKARILVLAAVAALLGSGAARAAATYRATDLGPGFGHDVNAAGVVVGQTGGDAFVWTAAAGLRDLGRGSADQVTEAGQVVGFVYVTDTTWHTFSWTSTGGLVDVGTLGGANSSPSDVSEAGQIVGQSNWAGFPPAVKAFSWTADGGMVDLGMLGLSNTIAYAVNDAGQVVGWSHHPFLWSAATGMIMQAGFDGAGSGINDAGQIVGWGSTPFGIHAVSWPAGGGFVDLGRVGPVSTPAIAINDAGDIVWLTKTDDGASHVMFLAPAGQPVDIGTLGGTSTSIPTQFPGLALNDAGQVVGWSTTAGGATHAFVWSLADGMTDLGTLGGATSQAAAISENGLVAGSSSAADGTIHATLWRLQRDTTPPVLAVADVAADATSPSGATVAYTVTARDDVDPDPSVVCTPASGRLFPIGDTTVTCTATDASGNVSTAAFGVHVRGAAEQTARLADAVSTLPIAGGLATSLGAKLHETATSQRLNAFVHEVDAQDGKGLLPADAASLRAAAERIEAVLGD